MTDDQCFGESEQAKKATLHDVDRSLRSHIARTDKRFRQVKTVLDAFGADEAIVIRDRINDLGERLKAQIMRITVLSVVAQYERGQVGELAILRNAIAMLDLPDNYWIGQAASCRTVDAWATLARDYDHVRDYDRLAGR